MQDATNIDKMLLLNYAMRNEEKEKWYSLSTTVRIKTRNNFCFFDFPIYDTSCGEPRAG